MPVRFGRKQWVSLLMLLVLLATSVSLAPAAFADNAGGSLGLQAAAQSGASANGNAPIVNPPQDNNAPQSLNLTKAAPAPNIVDGVVYYKAAPSDTTLTGQKKPQPGGLYMTHVVNMPPEVKHAPRAYTNNPTASQAAQNNGNVSGNASEANDLDLYDTGQAQSGVSGTVYGESAPSQPSVSLSVYSASSSSQNNSLSSGETAPEQSSVSSSVSNSVYFPIRNRGGRFTAGFARRREKTSCSLPSGTPR